jgi:hypothetical protein
VALAIALPSVIASLSIRGGRVSSSRTIPSLMLKILSRVRILSRSFQVAPPTWVFPSRTQKAGPSIQGSPGETIGYGRSESCWGSLNKLIPYVLLPLGYPMRLNHLPIGTNKNVFTMRSGEARSTRR